MVAITRCTYAGCVVLNRTGALLSAMVSVVLLGVVIARERATLNVLTGWTIALGFVAAWLLWRENDSRSMVAACVALLAAAIPALVGGLGLLYVPSLVIALYAAGRAADDSRSPRPA